MIINSNPNNNPYPDFDPNPHAFLNLNLNANPIPFPKLGKVKFNSLNIIKILGVLIETHKLYKT